MSCAGWTASTRELGEPGGIRTHDSRIVNQGTSQLAEIWQSTGQPVHALEHWLPLTSPFVSSSLHLRKFLKISSE